MRLRIHFTLITLDSMVMQLRSATLYAILLLLLPLWGSVQEDTLNVFQTLELLQQAEQREETRYGVSVWRIDQTKPALSCRASERFTPASVTKIFSSATVLIVLDADYQLPTEVSYRGTITSRGVLDGNLIIVGHDDPSLESKHYPHREGIFYDQVYLALQKAGIRQIRGRIIVDISVYYNKGYLETWSRVDWGKRYTPTLYGVNLYDNIMQVGISAQNVARGASEPSYLHPATPRHAWQIDIQLVKRGNPFTVSADRESRTTRRLPGRLAQSSSKRQVIARDLSNPTMALALRLAEYLQQHGIELSGCRSVAYYDRSAPILTILLDIYLSPHLSELIRTCNFHSVSLYTKVLLRNIGNHLGSVQQSECFSAHQALRREMDYWRETCALPADQLELYDGSGLSSRSKLSPYVLTAALRQIYQLPLSTSDPFTFSLPQVGRQGIVRNLMPALRIIAYFKSSSMQGVQSYAGYVSYKGRTYYVSLLANSIRHRPTTRSTMRRVLETLFPPLPVSSASKP